MQPTTLYPSKFKWIGVSLIGTCFVAIGIWMLFEGGGGAMPWLCTGFFGFVLAVGLLQLLPGMAYLKLEPDGFEYKSLFSTKRISWAEVTGFGTYSQNGNTFVTFDIGTTGKMASLNRAIAGGDKMLPDTYGMKPADLITLMSDYIVAYRNNEEAAGQA